MLPFVVNAQSRFLTFANCVYEVQVVCDDSDVDELNIQLQSDTILQEHLQVRQKT